MCHEHKQWAGQLFAVAVWVAGAQVAQAVPVVFQSNGPNVAAIQSNVDEFRSFLGANNGTGPGPFVGGRREINWDAVPEGSSSPNSFPGDFFNQTTAGRARGAVFSTPGTGFQVSANFINGTNTAIEFGNIEGTYPNEFTVFSAQKLFTPVGSNITDVTFSIPGQPGVPATTNGFGAVFTDVDLTGSTSIEYYNPTNQLLFSQTVRAAVGSETLSFLGVLFDAGEQVARVRIFSGNTAPGSGVLDNPGGGADIVAMDDFIYGEPVPEPLTMLLLGVGTVMMAARRRVG